MAESSSDRITVNVAYSNSWWAGTSALSGFFSYTEKFHAYTALKLDPIPHGTLLDTGFGSGYLLDQLCRIGKKGVRCVGLDISLKNVFRFNRYSHYGGAAAALPISPHCSQLPIKSESIDRVYCSHVLEHVPSDIELLSEIHRVVKPGGLAIIMVPVNEEKLDVPTHVRRYTGAGFAAMAGDTFSIMQQGQNDVFSHWIRCLALAKKPYYTLLKKLLIALLSLTPFRLVEAIDFILMARGHKPSQTYLVLKKKGV